MPTLKRRALRVIGNVGAIVFRDEKYKGPSARFLTDVRDLGKQGWNHQISSIRVTKTGVHVGWWTLSR